MHSVELLGQEVLATDLGTIVDLKVSIKWLDNEMEVNVVTPSNDLDIAQLRVTKFIKWKGSEIKDTSDKQILNIQLKNGGMEEVEAIITQFSMSIYLKMYIRGLFE